MTIKKITGKWCVNNDEGLKGAKLQSSKIHQIPLMGRRHTSTSPIHHTSHAPTAVKSSHPLAHAVAHTFSLPLLMQSVCRPPGTGARRSRPPHPQCRCRERAAAARALLEDARCKLKRQQPPVSSAFYERSICYHGFRGNWHWRFW